MPKSLKTKEFIAIAIGGMVGGGIFSILGISVSMIGFLAPFAIAFGAVFAFFAAYSYVKLGVYYLDEGATYAFVKKTFSNDLASAMIGWLTIFGYISTLALYAYTFSSYVMSSTEFAQNEIVRKTVAIFVIWLFALINLWSVKGMGRVEDVIVYAKVTILLIVSWALLRSTNIDFDVFFNNLAKDFHQSSAVHILMVSAVTFVAYEGFQLVINGVKDMAEPRRQIPLAIYSSILIVSLLYFLLALSSVLVVPLLDLVQNKEYALASGAAYVLGDLGKNLVIVGAILATTSAINGTIFGSSRQLARIADDGYLPSLLSRRRGTIPFNAIILMAFIASMLIVIGGLRLILEFGSITFLVVSLLVAVANFIIRDRTNSSLLMTIIAIIGLFIGAVLIFVYEYMINKEQLLFISLMYIILGLGAILYAKKGEI